MAMNYSNDVNRTKYKRSPYKNVLIEDLTNGIWDDFEKELGTRYGKIRRVRICGIIINKREINKLEVENTQPNIIENQKPNTRISFQIDDGTGNLWATLWGVSFDEYKKIQPGTLVDIIGSLRWYRENPQITLEYIRKVEDPNFEIYHLAEVIHKRKFEPSIKVETSEKLIFNDFENNTIESESHMEKIEEPKKGKSKKISLKNSEKENKEAQFIESLDEQGEQGTIESTQNDIINKNKSIPNNTKKSNVNQDIGENIIQFIKDNDNGDGVSIDLIGNQFGLGSDDLKRKLDQLCQNIKIYKVQPGYFSAY